MHGSAAAVALERLEESEQQLQFSRDRCRRLEHEVAHERARRLELEQETTILQGHLLRLEQFHASVYGDLTRELSIYRRTQALPAVEANPTSTTTQPGETDEKVQSIGIGRIEFEGIEHLKSLVRFQHEESRWPGIVKGMQKEIDTLHTTIQHLKAKLAATERTCSHKVEELTVSKTKETERLKAQVEGLNQALSESRGRMIFQKLKTWRWSVFELREDLFSIRHALHTFRRSLQENFSFELIFKGIGILGEKVDMVRAERTATRKNLNDLRNQMSTLLQGVAPLETIRHNLGRGDDISQILKAVEILRNAHVDTLTELNRRKAELLNYQLRASLPGRTDTQSSQTSDDWLQVARGLLLLSSRPKSSASRASSPSDSSMMNISGHDGGRSTATSPTPGSQQTRKEQTPKYTIPSRRASGASLTQQRSGGMGGGGLYDSRGSPLGVSGSKPSSPRNAQNRSRAGSERAGDSDSGEEEDFREDLEEMNAESLAASMEYAKWRAPAALQEKPKYGTESQPHPVAEEKGADATTASAPSELGVDSAKPKIRRRRGKGKNVTVGSPKGSSEEPSMRNLTRQGHLPSSIEPDNPTSHTTKDRDRDPLRGQVDVGRSVVVVAGSKFKYPLPIPLSASPSALLSYPKPDRPIAPAVPTPKRQPPKESPNPVTPKPGEFVPSPATPSDVAPGEEPAATTSAPMGAPSAATEEKGDPTLRDKFRTAHVYFWWRARLARRQRRRLVHQLDDKIRLALSQREAERAARAVGGGIVDAHLTPAANPGTGSPSAQGATAAPSESSAKPRRCSAPSSDGNCCEYHRDQAFKSAIREYDLSQVSRPGSGLSPRTVSKTLVSPAHRPAPPKRFSAQEIMHRCYPDVAWVAQRRMEMEERFTECNTIVAPTGNPGPTPSATPSKDQIKKQGESIEGHSHPHSSPIRLAAPKDNPVVHMTTARPSSARYRIGA
jgi:hypothetical protein